MAVQDNEIKWYKAAVMASGASNGGRMSAVESVSLTKNNVWPDIDQAERAVGSTKYRKTFIKTDNSANDGLVNPKAFIETPSPGDDSVMIFAGTQTDTESALTGSERTYGAGILNVGVSAGATSIDVTTEGAAFLHFQDGDEIRISDQATVLAAGSYEYATISGAPTYVGDVATITLASPLANTYTDTVTRVASILALADIKAAFDTFGVTSASGTYDSVTEPVLLDGISAVDDTWTLTFTSGTAFNIVGTATGAAGSGSIGTATAPNNPDFGAPYFTLASAGFGGTFLSGDTIIFHTTPAGAAVWEKRVVPIGAASLAGNKRIIGLLAETA
jgi:hypothetical protein